MLRPLVAALALGLLAVAGPGGCKGDDFIVVRCEPSHYDDGNICYCTGGRSDGGDLKAPCVCPTGTGDGGDSKAVCSSPGGVGGAAGMGNAGTGGAAGIAGAAGHGGAGAGGCTVRTWYLDVDGDSYAPSTVTKTACDPPGNGWHEGTPTAGMDCNDNEPLAHPGADFHDVPMMLPGGATSWDWNCDGTETKAVTDVSTKPFTCTQNNFGVCSPGEDMQAHVIKNGGADLCGATVQTVACKPSTPGMCATVVATQAVQQCK